MLTITNEDNMKLMARYPDKHFELAIVDPPYGGGLTQEAEDASADTWQKKKRSRFGGLFDKYKIERTGGTWAEKYQNTNNIKHWDVAPEDKYFEELFRVSKNQIIWGGNYFGLPPNRCFLIWKKLTISESFSLAMAEYAWTSFNLNAKIFECAPQDKARFHPTQKPVKLYRWLLKNYAKQGDKILDTHLGSGSIAIACHEMGFDLTACELDKDYFDKAMQRIKNETQQERLCELC